MSKRICKECEVQFFGRSDKKFCTDSCRSQYHNKERQESGGITRLINRLLSRNRKILSEIREAGDSVVQKELLLGKGFSFSYFTNERINTAGELYRCCYDFGYRVTDNGSVLLHKFEQ